MSVILSQEMLNEIRLESDVFRWKFANDSERLNSTDMTNSDVGKLALQLDNFTIWILKDAQTKIWIPLNKNANIKRISDNYEAIVDDFLFIDCPDTSCEYYIILPKDAADGDKITIVDGRCNFGLNDNIKVFVRSAFHDIYLAQRSSIRLNTTGIVVEFIFNRLLSRWMLNPGESLYSTTDIGNPGDTNINYGDIFNENFKEEYLKLYLPTIRNLTNNTTVNDNEVALVTNESANVTITLNNAPKAKITVKNLSKTKEVNVKAASGVIDKDTDTVILTVEDFSFTFLCDENGTNWYVI